LPLEKAILVDITKIRNKIFSLLYPLILTATFHSGNFFGKPKYPITLCFRSRSAFWKLKWFIFGRRGRRTKLSKLKSGRYNAGNVYKISSEKLTTSLFC